MVYAEQLVTIPAENLPAHETAQAIQKYNARQKPAGIFHSAWSHVEFALSSSNDIDDDIRREYFDIAQTLLGSIIINPESHNDTRFGAYLLSSYVPIFKKRRFKEPLSAQDCRGLYDSIGAAIALMRPLGIDEPPQSIMLEAGCEALSARSLQPENLLYPTSPREEASPYARYNHDSYFFVHPHSKLPLQQKLTPTNKIYDESVRILTLLPLLEKGARKARIELASASSERLNYLLGLIVADTHHQPVTRNEKQLLNYMTRSIIAHKQPMLMSPAA